MSTPTRIQRQRAKGWRMPEGATYVGRPTRWGNPFQVVKVPHHPRWAGINPRQVVTDDGRVWFWPSEAEPAERPVVFNQPPDYIDGNRYYEGKAAALATYLFELHTGPMGGFEYEEDTLADLRATLGGQDLACWCPLDQPCHADVLLQLANGGAPA